MISYIIMSKRPKCIQNINNICEGLNLIKIIKQHRYVQINDLDIVLKTMYPHAQYNDPVPVKHGCKCHYRNAIDALWNINATCSASTLSKLIGPIYNFDIANPEYIEPNNLSLEELIPAFAEFVTNHKYPMNEDTDLISIGRPIKFETFEDCRIISRAIVNLLRCNDTALLDAISAEYSNFDSYIYHNAHWDRFAQDPNFAYISKTVAIRRNSHLKLVIAVIYTKLLQEREAMVQDREINITEIRDRLNTILISEGGEPGTVLS